MKTKKAESAAIKSESAAIALEAIKKIMQSGNKGHTDYTLTSDEHYEMTARFYRIESLIEMLLDSCEQHQHEKFAGMSFPLLEVVKEKLDDIRPFIIEGHPLCQKQDKAA
jgi:hypothetical protein